MPDAGWPGPERDEDHGTPWDDDADTGEHWKGGTPPDQGDDWKSEADEGEGPNWVEDRADVVYWLYRKLVEGETEDGA